MDMTVGRVPTLRNITSNPVQPPTMSGGGVKPMIPNGVQTPSSGGLRMITGNEPIQGGAPKTAMNQPLPLGPMPYAPVGPVGPGGPPQTGGPMPGPPVPPWMQPPQGGPPMGIPPWQNVNGGGFYGDYNDPFNAYLSMIPVMQNQMNKDIGGAMATAGFGGNRYSSAAAEAAGQIGAESAMKMNQMLNQTMFDQSNRDIDRALASTKMFGDWSLQEDQGERDWMRDLMEFGQYEQGRQDKYGMLGYEDFINSRLGYLPYLIQAGAGTGAGSSPQPYQVMTNPGQQGWGDDAMDLFGQILGLFS